MVQERASGKGLKEGSSTNGLPSGSNAKRREKKVGKNGVKLGREPMGLCLAGGGLSREA